jgi:hypothetical protein
LTNGTFKPAPSDDLSGIARPMGNGFDAGAYEYPVLPADANYDQTVDTADFKILLDNYGKPGDFKHGDFNHDGTIDFPDFQILELTFGQALLPGAPFAIAPVPEPSFFIAMLAPAAAMFQRRQRRHPDGA